MSEKGDRCREALKEFIDSFKDFFGEAYPAILDTLIPSLEEAIKTIETMQELNKVDDS